jgi:hypothetical protein
VEADMRVQRVNDVSAIRDAVEIPGLGALPINAYVVHAEQPVLVDTGRPVERKAFLDNLGSTIDLEDIRWIWLTHPDRDHMGSLFDVLAAAPQARLVSTFLAVGYLTVEFDMPLDRCFLLNPGQALDVGDRKLHAFRPPLFDSPMTVGFYDDKTGTCISSDCFGAPMPSLDGAMVDDVAEVAASDLRNGQLVWAGGDSPWVRNVDRVKFAASYDGLRRFAPETVLSTHLPPARGLFDTFLGMLEQAPDAPEFVGPDQAQLEAMLAGAIPQQPGAQQPVAH